MNTCSGDICAANTSLVKSLDGAADLLIFDNVGVRLVRWIRTEISCGPTGEDVA